LKYIYIYNRWLSFSAGKDWADNLTYSFALLEQDDFNQIGKELQDGIGRDSAATDETARKAEMIRQKRRDKGNTNKENNSKQGDMASTIHAIANKDREQQSDNANSELQFKALTFFAESTESNETDKNKAMKKLREIAFGISNSSKRSRIILENEDEDEIQNSDSD
jgi:hypothetical protein